MKFLGLPRMMWHPVFVILSGALALAVFVRMRRGRTQSPWERSIAEDLAGGNADQIACDITVAIQVEEFEDEGSNYFPLFTRICSRACVHAV